MSYQEQLEPLTPSNLELQANVHPPDWQNPTPSGRYHLVVIGAGTAGLVTAAGAAGLGAKVALIERGLMGGDCLNVGCVPSKAILSTARRIASFRDAAEFGVEVAPPEIQFGAIMERMRRLRASISPHDSARRFASLGVDVFFGQGTFISSNQVEVAGQTLQFKQAVVATGARAAVPPIPGLDQVHYLTNETLFSLTECPARLLVIGGGPIGCEMAQAFARFGAAVTLVETGPHVLSREDSQAAAVVQASLIQDGVHIVGNAEILRVESRDGASVVFVKHNEQTSQIVVDRILVAAGRTPNLDGLGLDVVGVQNHPRTGIEVDDFLRTTNRRIFAAGDVCSTYKFTHAADFLARIVIQNALFMGRGRASRLLIPWCTYTSPEVAHVGLSSADAERQGCDTYTQRFSSVDRAILDSDTAGFVKVHCRRGTDKILGATIVATNAGDMIGEIVMAMKHHIGLRKIAGVIHPYPTHAEAIRKLGDQYNRTRLTPWVKSLFDTWLRWTR